MKSSGFGRASEDIPERPFPIHLLTGGAHVPLVAARAAPHRRGPRDAAADASAVAAASAAPAAVLIFPRSNEEEEAAAVPVPESA